MADNPMNTDPEMYAAGFKDVGLAEGSSSSNDPFTVDQSTEVYGKKRAPWLYPGFYKDGGGYDKMWADNSFSPWVRQADDFALTQEVLLLEDSIKNKFDQQERNGKSPSEYAQWLLKTNPGISPGVLAATVLGDIPLTSDIENLDGLVNNPDVKMNPVAGSPASPLPTVKIDAATGQAIDSGKKIWTDPTTRRTVRLGPDDYILRTRDGKEQAFSKTRDSKGNPIAITSADRPGAEPEDNNNPLFNAAKWTTRNLMAAAQLPYQGGLGVVRGITGAFAEGGGGIKEAAQYALDSTIIAPLIEDALASKGIGSGDRINAWEQTLMGQTIVQATGGDASLAVDQGTGWFVSDTSAVGEAQRRAAYDVHVVNGEAWTLGRGAATFIGLTPEDNMYRTLSGTVDFISAVGLDPVNWIPGTAVTKGIVALGGPAIGKTARALAAQNDDTVRALQMMDRMPKLEAEEADLTAKIVAGELKGQALTAAEKQLEDLAAERDTFAPYLDRYNAWKNDQQEITGELGDYADMENSVLFNDLVDDGIRRAAEASDQVRGEVLSSRRLVTEHEARFGTSIDGRDNWTVDDVRDGLGELAGRFDRDAFDNDASLINGIVSDGIISVEPIDDTRSFQGTLLGGSDAVDEGVGIWEPSNAPNLIEGTAEVDDVVRSGLVNEIKRLLDLGDRASAEEIRAALKEAQGWGYTPSGAAGVDQTIPARANAFIDERGQRYVVDRELNVIRASSRGDEVPLGSVKYLTADEVDQIKAAQKRGSDPGKRDLTADPTLDVQGTLDMPTLKWKQDRHEGSWTGDYLTELHDGAAYIRKVPAEDGKKVEFSVILPGEERAHDIFSSLKDAKAAIAQHAKDNPPPAADLPEGFAYGRTYGKGPSSQAVSAVRRKNPGMSYDDAYRIAGGRVEEAAIIGADEPAVGLHPVGRMSDGGYDIGPAIRELDESFPSYVDSANELVATAANLSDDIIAQLGDDTTVKTYVDLLQLMDDNGLAPVLQRMLNDEGIDGIGNLLGNGKGFWYGYTDKVNVFPANLTALGSPALREFSDGSANVMASPGAMSVVLRMDDVMAGPRQQRIDALDKIRRDIAADEQRLADGSSTDPIALQQLIEQQRAVEAEIQAELFEAEKVMPIKNLLSADSHAERVKVLEQMMVDNKGRVGQVASRYGRDIRNVQTRMDLLEETKAMKARLSEIDNTKSTIQAMAGVGTTAEGRRWSDSEALFKFLTGGGFKSAKYGQNAINALTKITDRGALYRLSKEKWDTELIDDLVRNAERTDIDDLAKREEVMRLLGTRVGPGIDKGQRSIDKALPVRQLSRINQEPSMVSTTSAVGEALSKWTRYVPGVMAADLTDVDDLVKKLSWYLNKTPDRLMSQDDKDAWIGKLIETRISDDVPEEIAGIGREGLRRNIMTDALDKVYEARVKEAAERSGVEVDSPEGQVIAQSMRSAFRAYEEAIGGEKRYYQNRVGNTVPTIYDGANEIPLTSAQISAEFASGVMPMPPPEVFGRAVSRVLDSLKERNPKTVDVGLAGKDIVDAIFNDYWRSLMLMRPAYVIRNIAEMNIRTFMSGHESYFSDPLAMLGMGAMNPDSAVSRSLMKMWDKYYVSAAGTPFRPEDAAEELADIQMAALRNARREKSRNDFRRSRSYQGSDSYVALTPSHPNFNAAWAHELMLLRSDPVVQRIVVNQFDENYKPLVAAGQITPEQAMSESLRLDATIRAELANGGDEFAKILDSKEAFYSWLYGNPIDPDEATRLAQEAGGEWAFGLGARLEPGENWGVAQRINDFTANDDALKGFLATGRIKMKDGSSIKGRHDYGDTVVLRRLAIENDEQQKILASILGQTFRRRGGFDDSILSNMRVFGSMKNEENLVDRGISGWFRLSAKVENQWTANPEFRVQYFEELKGLAPYMTAEAKATALSNLQGTLRSGVTGRVKNAIPVGKHPVERALSGDKHGYLTIDDVERIATQRSIDHIENLFYDAQHRQQGWNSLRLLMPFGQAWWNSMGTVGRLSMRNPRQTYKAARAYQALGGDQTLEGVDIGLPGIEFDEVIEQQREMSKDPRYDGASASWIRAEDGLLQRDAFGAQTILVPGLGNVTNAFTKALGNAFGVEGANQVDQEQTYALKNLNLVFGGDLPLPGVGPLGTITAQGIRGIYGGWDEYSTGTNAENFLNRWLFPFGDVGAGDALTFGLPGSITKAANAAFGGSLNGENAKNVGAAMNYLTASGEYDLTASADRSNFMRDTGVLARLMSGLEAIGQFMGPTTPQAVNVLRDGNDYEVGMAQLANVYYNEYLSVANGDRKKALADFVDDYGPEFVSVVVGSSTGGFQVSDQAWQMAGDFTQEWEDNPELFSLLYPGARTSVAASQFIKESDLVSARTPEERTEVITGNLYRARLGRLEYLADKQGWTDEKFDYAKEELEVDFNGYDFATAGAASKPTEDTVASMKEYLDSHPSLSSVPSYKAFNEAYDLRQQAMARSVELRGEPGLKAKAAAPILSAYMLRLADIESRYPGSGLVVNIFAREWE